MVVFGRYREVEAQEKSAEKAENEGAAVDQQEGAEAPLAGKSFIH